MTKMEHKPNGSERRDLGTLDGSFDAFSQQNWASKDDIFPSGRESPIFAFLNSFEFRYFMIFFGNRKKVCLRIAKVWMFRSFRRARVKKRLVAEINS